MQKLPKTSIRNYRIFHFINFPTSLFSVLLSLFFQTHVFSQNTFNSNIDYPNYGKFNFDLTSTQNEKILKFPNHDQQLPFTEIVLNGKFDKTSKNSSLSDPYFGWEGHWGDVECIRYNNTGSIIATSGWTDGTVRLWNSSNGSLLRVINLGLRRIGTLSFSPDGSKLAFGTYLIYVVNPNDGNIIRTIYTNSWANFIVFSPDGTKLAAGCTDSTIKIFNSNDGTLFRTLKGHSGAVNSLAFTPDGYYLASGSDDKTIKVWNTYDGSLFRTLSGHTNKVLSVAFASDNKQLASGSYDYSVKLWDIANGQLLKTITGHYGEVHSVAFSPDGTKLVSAAYDYTVRIWNSFDGTLLKLISPVWTYSIAFSPDGYRLIAGGGTMTFTFIDPNTGSILNNYYGHAGEISSIDYSPDGSRLVSGCEWGDNLAKIWDPSTGTLIRSLPVEVYGPSAVKYSPDGTKIATGGTDNLIKIWNATDGSLVRTLTGHTGYAFSISFSPDGSKLASGSYDQTIKIWNLNDGTLIKTLIGHTGYVYSVAFSPDGNLIASGSSDNSIKIWNVSDGTLLRTLSSHTSPVYSVAFSPDGTMIASGSGDRSIKFWDPRNGYLFRTLTGHNNLIYSVDFSNDGAKLASGSYDGTIKIWNPKDGSLLRTIVFDYGYPNSICYNSTGNKIASGGNGYKHLRIYDESILTISGMVTLNGVGLAGITVLISGNGSVITNSSGLYSFIVNSGGTYTVSCFTSFIPGITFTPANKTFLNISSSQTQNFIANITTYTISGTVTSNGTGLSGATMTLSGSSSAITTTDINGNYSFTVSAGGTYIVTPTKTNYTFSPVSQSFPNISGNQTQNFIATLNSFLITGKVNYAGIGLSGVTINYSGTSNGNTTTDANGNYSFSVPAGGTYSITPSKTNYSFTPTNQSFTNIAANQTQDFIATLNSLMINGKVTSGGSGLSGVTLTLSGSSSGTTATDTYGNYSFSVSSGGTYTVTPLKTNYSFNPANKTFTNITSNQTQDFIATQNSVTIGGRVTLGVSGLSDVTISFAGSTSGSTTTNSDGYYSFTVNYGGTYTITASKINYSFNPTNKIFTNITSTQTQDFSASQSSFVIWGNIYYNNSPLSGVKVTMSGSSSATTTTDATGFYVFNVNPGGTYTITPSKINYSFNPSNKTFSNVGSDNVQNFTATYNVITISGIILANGIALSGVTVTLSGTSSGAYVTDPNGFYTFNVNSGGTCTVTPTKTGYGFTPASQTFENIQVNLTQNFAAFQNPYKISGTISSNGNGLSGVTVTLNGSSTGSTITDINGNYSFNVNPEGTYIITPAKSGYTFSPSSQTFTNLLSDQSQNFIASLASFTISGTAYTGLMGLQGVTILLSGSSSGIVVTDNVGYYSFNVSGGGDYTITPSKSGYAFSPTSQTFSNLSENKTQNFSSSLNSYIISGQVTYNGFGLSGVTISLTGSSTGTFLTNSSGAYSISINAGGSYTIIPSNTNYSFTPVNQTFNNLSANQVQNFIASLNTFKIIGRITYNGVGLSGVTILLSGSSSSTTTSDVNGNYSFTVASGGNFQITPSLNNYTFSPISMTCNNVTSDQNEKNFTGNIIQPGIRLNKTSLNFTMLEGGDIPASQNFSITNSGGGTLIWNISSSNNSWLTITPTSGTGDGLIDIKIKSNTLTGVNYTATLSISSLNASNSPQSLSVTLNIYSYPKATIESTDPAVTGSDKKINFLISSNTTPQSISVFYRLGGETNYESSLASFSNNQYSFIIPKEKITKRGLDYYFEVNYGQYIARIFDPSGKNVPMTLQTKLTTITPEYNLKLSKYSLASSIKMVGTNVMDELINILGAYNKAEWRVLKWLNNNYVEYINWNSLNLEVGDGFWIILGVDKPISFSNCITTPTNIPFKITLYPGWNQIGNPFLFPISISNLEIPEGKKVEQLWGWDNQENNYFVENLKISPWTGYFLKNNELEPVEIKINPVYYSSISNNFSNKNLQNSIANINDLGYGECKIIVNLDNSSIRSVSKSDNTIQFGILQNAMDEWDKNDLSVPPPAPLNNNSIITVCFPHPEWKSCSGSYVRDFRATGKENYVWDMQISNSGSYFSDVNLNFQLSGNFQNDSYMTIYDYDFNRIISEIKIPSITQKIPMHFEQNQFSKLIRITIGTKENIKKDEIYRAVDWKLWQNYPNPFNPSTRIDYRVPENSFITIKIYNSLFQEIQSIIAKQHAQGIYSVEWEPINLPSGIYFYQLRTETYSEIKKMLYVR